LTTNGVINEVRLISSSLALAVMTHSAAIPGDAWFQSHRFCRSNPKFSNEYATLLRHYQARAGSRKSLRKALEHFPMILNRFAIS